jgi:8-oxo-dGTP pyrophosphatase MutT (NUDIX family)
VKGLTLASGDLAVIRGVGQRASLRGAFQSWRGRARTIVAAVCYRLCADGGIEFLLVRTRAGRWTFPKGGVDDDPSAAAAAAREAQEEAGVLGRVEPRSFTHYLHSKGDHIAHKVDAHLCEVLHLERPAEFHRTPTWFSAEKAKRRLREDRPIPYADELERVVDHAVRRLAASDWHPRFPRHK